VENARVDAAIGGEGVVVVNGQCTKATRPSHHAGAIVPSHRGGVARRIIDKLKSLQLGIEHAHDGSSPSQPGVRNILLAVVRRAA
jgi:hypothetical protein